MELARTVGTTACILLLISPAVSVAQHEVPNQIRAARRTALLLSRSNLLPEARSTTSVVGSVWSPRDEGVPDMTVRLRDFVLGEISAVTWTNEAGDFAFEQVASGTYILEVAEQEDGNPVALGDIFTIGPDETVAIFVKLPAPLGWTSTLAALLGAPSGAARSGVGASGAAEGSTFGPVGSGRAGTFDSTVASVVSSAASAGVTGVGGGRAASNDDQSR